MSIDFQRGNRLPWLRYRTGIEQIETVIYPAPLMSYSKTKLTIQCGFHKK